MSATTWNDNYRRANEIIEAVKNSQKQQPALLESWKASPEMVIAELLEKYRMEDGIY